LNFYGRIALAAVLALTVPAAASAQNTAGVSVFVNGAQLQFDQPPVERAGRVFVPLRGVFERLGASVVFANGEINATAGERTVALHIGSTSALVSGRQQYLDSPPFLIGARTLVPLRFVSQALGAVVSFDNRTQTVYLSQAGLPPAPPPGPVAGPPQAVQPPPTYAQATPPPAPPPGAELPRQGPAVGLLRVEPPRRSSLTEKRPDISASFVEAVAPDSIRIELDGRDVTQQSYVSRTGFAYDPDSDLPPGPHEVVVHGRADQQGPFTDRWSFTTGDGENPNYISGLEPPNGTPAGQSFAVSGITRPNSEISVIATTNEAAPDFNEAADDVVTARATADPSGYFDVRIVLPRHASRLVDVRIISTAPDNAVSTRALRLLP